MSSLAVSAHHSIEKERRARRFWVSLIVGLLGLQVVIGVTSIVLSVGDPSVSVVPNYHQAALDWDTTHRAQVLAQSLQWKIDTTVSKPISSTGKRVMEISVRDRYGKYLSGLVLTAQIYPHARGSAVFKVALAEGDDGRYAAVAKLDRTGLWQIDLQIEGEHGIASVSQELEIE